MEPSAEFPTRECRTKEDPTLTSSTSLTRENAYWSGPVSRILPTECFRALKQPNLTEPSTPVSTSKSTSYSNREALERTLLASPLPRSVSQVSQSLTVTEARWTSWPPKRLLAGCGNNKQKDTTPRPSNSPLHVVGVRAAQSELSVSRPMDSRFGDSFYSGRMDKRVFGRRNIQSMDLGYPKVSLGNGFIAGIDQGSRQMTKSVIPHCVGSLDGNLWLTPKFECARNQLGEYDSDRMEKTLVLNDNSGRQDDGTIFYEDPVLGASDDFIARLSEFSILEESTTRWERGRARRRFKKRTGTDN